MSEAAVGRWKTYTSEEKSEIGKKLARRYRVMGVRAQERLGELAQEGVRRASKEGSRLEKFILVGLRQEGYEPEFHVKWATEDRKLHVDIVLRKPRVAIEVDGPAHFRAIWGPEVLKKREDADRRKDGLLLNQGFLVIRVRQLVNHLSRARMGRALKGLLEAIRAGGEGIRFVDLGE